MNPAWPMLDGEVILTEEVQPLPLLANVFRRIGECSMVCSDDNGPSKQMLPVFLETKHHT